METVLPIIQDRFETIKISNEDIAIKSTVSDKWMRLQIKTYNTHCMIRNSFTDFLIVLLNKDGSNAWIIPRKDAINLRRIGIGKKTSKYNKYLVARNDIVDTVIASFAKVDSFSKEDVISIDVTPTVPKPNAVAYTYADICSKVSEKGCIVVSVEDEYTHTKGPIDIEYICGHIDTTTYNIFSRRACFACNECGTFERSKTSYDHKEGATVVCVNESKHIEKFCTHVSTNMSVCRTYEHCKADLMVKPKTVEEDLWLPIQVKTTIGSCSQFTFNLKSDYPDMIILCIAADQYWLFHGTYLTGKKSLSIGKTHSKYDKFLVNPENISHILETCYTQKMLHGIELVLDTSASLNTPPHALHLKEHTHRMQREKTLGTLFEITYPSIEGSKTDCFVNGLRVQDKTAWKLQHLNDSYKISFGKKYKIGDNDIYWIYFTTMYANRFFVLPECFLIDNGYFDRGLLQNINVPMERPHMLHQFMFDYDNLDINRLKRLIGESRHVC